MQSPAGMRTRTCNPSTCEAANSRVDVAQANPTEGRTISPAFMAGDFSSLSVLLLLLGVKTGSHYVAPAAFRLSILLPQLPKHWNYRCEPPPAPYFE